MATSGKWLLFYDESHSTFWQVSSVPESADVFDTNWFVIGLSGDEADRQRRIDDYGKNTIPPKKPKSFFTLMGEAVQDLTLIVLICASVVSVGLSLLQMSGVIKSAG